MKIAAGLIAIPAFLSLSACSSQDLALFADAMEQAAYESQYNNYYSPYGNQYATPSTGVGSWVGYNQCQHTGSFYTCDTDGNGYADMYGDTSDGSYSSSHLRVNGRGEAYTYDSNRGEWVRNRAYDGPRKDYDHYKGDRHYNGGHHHDKGKHDRDGRY